MESNFIHTSLYVDLVYRENVSRDLWKSGFRTIIQFF
jgi:hypothetical protein